MLTPARAPDMPRRPPRNPAATGPARDEPGQPVAEPEPAQRPRSILRTERRHATCGGTVILRLHDATGALLDARCLRCATTVPHWDTRIPGQPGFADRPTHEAD